MRVVEFATMKTINSCFMKLNPVTRPMAYVASQIHRQAIVLLVMGSKFAVWNQKMISKANIRMCLLILPTIKCLLFVQWIPIPSVESIKLQPLVCPILILLQQNRSNMCHRMKWNMWKDLQRIEDTMPATTRSKWLTRKRLVQIREFNSI